MYLIQCCLNGDELPDILPESLNPPRSNETEETIDFDNISKEKKGETEYRAIPVESEQPVPNLNKSGSGILQRDIVRSQLRQSASGPSLNLVIFFKSERKGYTDLFDRLFWEINVENRL